MIVVADTSTLNYLILINCETLLPQLYERVFVPSSVMHELGHAKSPPAVRNWLLQVPDWIEVRTLKRPLDAALALLDVGEGEAIQLAQEERADRC